MTSGLSVGIFGAGMSPKEDASVLLYNLFPLLAGPVTRWSPHLERAADLGFDWVFVNPIQRSGQSGSLYSIADYFAVDPRFVDVETADSPEDQVRAMVAEAERLGLRMMVDLVINHCAYDAPLVRESPAWFAHENGQVAHPFCVTDDGSREVWRDLARFDHAHTSDPEGLFDYLVRVLDYLLGLGFRGFRCDAAYQLPGSLWERLIETTRRRHPDVVFAAETLGCTADRTRATARAGFDYIFNSSKWWNFTDPWLMEQYHLLREFSRSISFPESHDTERLCQETGGNRAVLEQRYLFAALFSSGVMMPMGYEFGFRKRMHVVHSSPDDWESTDIDLCDFVRATNRVVADHAIFREDCPTEVLAHENQAILLLWKGSTRSTEEALILLNKDPYVHQSFYAADLGRYVQAGSALRDVSPAYPLDYLPRPFDYALRPGQGFVWVTDRA